MDSAPNITNRTFYEALRDNIPNFWTRTVIENKQFLLNYVKSLLGTYRTEDEIFQCTIGNRILGFYSNVTNKLKACRYRWDYFEHKYKIWLDRDFNIAVPVAVVQTTQSVGRPSTRFVLFLLYVIRFYCISISFADSSNRTKRRKTEELRSIVSPEELYFATKVMLHNEGKRAAADLVEQATATSPKRPIKIQRIVRRSLQGKDTVVPFTDDEALAHMIKCHLSKVAYKETRIALKKRNANIFPSYHKIISAKQRCYPSSSDIKITDLGRLIIFLFFSMAHTTCF